MLGKQAEFCFEFYLRNVGRYKLLGANIQIQGPQQTIGELDYIVFDSLNNVNLHIELACKFYLFDPTIEGKCEAKWIGPNRKDTLEEKLEKLASKQFPLLFDDQTKLELDKLKITVDTVKQQLFLKACLFLPKKYDINELPENFQDCVVGYWIYFSDFISEDKDALYIVPSKKQWLLQPEKFEVWQPFSEAITTIELSLITKKSPLVYKKTEQKIERIFVVWW